MASAEIYWDQYYEKAQPEDPSPFLKHCCAKLQKGRVLDIGMGAGQNAVYLAQQGFSVKGVDLSQTAIDRAQALAYQRGVKIEAVKADLDLFIMGLMEYDSIIMCNFRPSIPRYYTEMLRSLKQGGTILVDAKTTEEIKDVIPNSESFRNQYFSSNELLGHLKGLRILFYQEDIIEGVHRVQCLAKRPLDKDAVKYGFFGMHSQQEKDAGMSQAQKLAEQFFKK